MSFRPADRHTAMTSTTETAGDRGAFEAQVRRHARELHVHCYRMTGSVEESEDLVQETFLRAWRKREQFAGRSTLRAWLYRIATNACLDALDKRPRTATADGEVLWLQPYPDSLLEALPASEDGPEDARGRQGDHRADVPHRDPAPAAAAAGGLHPPRRPGLLGQGDRRAARDDGRLGELRAAARPRRPARAPARARAQWRPEQEPSAAERELLARYVEASEQADPEGFVAVLHDDVRFWMPPQPGVWEGRDTVVGAWVEGGFGSDAFGSLRCVVTRANRQPAVACYVRRPGDAEHRRSPSTSCASRTAWSARS
jgi:RNA polymerase sigma-70 factor (ECF subfamily)